MMSYTLKKRKWRGTLSALAEALNEPEKEHPDQQLAALVYAYAFGIDVDKDRVRTVYLASRSDPRQTARAILSDEIGRKLKTDDEFLQALASSN